jgi:predicted DNA binding CopG/RHH family protein
MDLAPYLEAVRTDLEAVSGSDEATLAVAERLTRALEPSLQLRLLDALGQAAQELSEQLPSGRVDVRLSGRDVQLVVAFDESPAEPVAAEEEGGTARITLRLPENAKTRVEREADREGISTNSWLVRTVMRGLEQRQHQQRQRRVGNRIRGMAES